MGSELLSITLLGVGFMLIFSAFQPMKMMQENYIESVNQDHTRLAYSGYTGLAILHTVAAVCNWFCPSIIEVVGPNVTLILGALPYLIFFLCFLVETKAMFLTQSAICGIGSALLWNAHGYLFVMCSSEGNYNRNSGIFWVLYEISMIIGNLYLYFVLGNMEHIELKVRQSIIYVFTGLVGAGILVLLPIPCQPRGIVLDLTMMDTFRETFTVLTSKELALATITFAHSGFYIGFCTGIYCNAIGFSEQFDLDAKTLGALAGVIIGSGEIVGGILFGVGFEKSWMNQIHIMLIVCILEIIALILIYINLADVIIVEDVNAKTMIESETSIAFIAAFLLGFADAGYNIQIYTYLAMSYEESVSSAFAVFKCLQALSQAGMFLMAIWLTLYTLIYFLMASSVAGVLSFVVNLYLFGYRKY